MRWISSEIKLKKRHCTRLNPKPYSGAYYISGANTNNNRKYGDPDSVMIRQRLMQLFGEAGQCDASKLPAPLSSELCNSMQTEYKFMSLLTAEMLLRDLAMWLGKYAGVTLTHAARIEEYAVRALAKMAHSSASRLGKRLHETART